MPLTLDAQGLQIQTQEELFEELAAKLQGVFGNILNTTIQSVTGQFMNIMAELRAADQNTLLAVYRSFDANSATGVNLDRLAALTGSVRFGASQSTVEGLIEFGGPAVVADGFLFLNDDQQTQWATINGPYADTGGPYPELVAAQVQAVDIGPITADAGTNWSPITVQVNVDDFTNPVEDATTGRLIEGDPEFRVRRTLELFSQGQGPLAAINAIVSKVNTENGRVDSVRTYHNPAINPVDSDGIPFKAFNVVVETTPSPPPVALQQDIFDSILTAAGAGLFAYGTDFVGTAIDEENQVQNMAFDLVANLDVYMLITIETALMTGGDLPVTPLDPLVMATLIQDAVVTAAQEQYTIIGRDFRELDYMGVITALLASGELDGIDVIDIQVSSVSKLGPYTPNFVPIGIRQKIDLDSGELRVIVDGNVIIA